ncbi:putative O-glycosylation ligase, exosortase A system-associated [Kordiimonas aestuarii]|uniref:putative O-glycosylation ligase, exosortase A system-associated n=1 Tax=Kordiimonas aestuarii TaxID=1005925 RepID=UPI0021D2DED6|nr:putative O-glycosylation ligase, exosortase A system-associated [Kordiimonas aestuarii]
MRGAIVALLLLMWMPFVVFKPYVGVLLWDWISHMNPHKQTFGFARSFPFLDAVAALTFLGLILSKDKKNLPGHPVIAAMLLYFLWTAFTTLTAFEPNYSSGKLLYLFKVMLFAFVATAVMQSPNRVKAFVYVMAASLMFIGIKGGLFTFITGGSGRVQGAGGMMEDNNQLAMAMAMLLPLSIYLVQFPPHRLLKWPAIGATLTIIVSIVGTQSRGGFVALASVLGMMLLKSKYRFKLLAVSIPLIVGGFFLVPDSWKARIQSTESATEDSSFLGRVVMWKFSSNLADENPIEGGGFNVFYVRRALELYLPPGHKGRAPHSVYFEVLGEHGYGGLFLFLTMLFTAWYAAGTNAKRFRPYEQTRWLGELSAALQLGLVGYAVGGLTVNIATFDLFYHYMAVVVMCSNVGNHLLTKQLTVNQGGVSVAASTKWAPPRPVSQRTQSQPAQNQAG